MLSVHVVRGAGVDYYLSDLVPGRAEGTGVAGESPGLWAGGGPTDLGLRGEVTGVDLAAVLDGRDPRGGGPLRQVQGSRPVAGFDLLFTAPKDVSVLHLLGPRELGAATGAAHVAAVADAVTYLDRCGLGVRRSDHGTVRHLATTGVVAAGFVHRTSRALDPHLHTHLVAANVAQGIDGRWSAVDSRRLFLHRRATRAVYEASLRHHLGRAVGVSWRVNANGSWSVDGVDPVLCRLFSQRSASIEQVTQRLAGVRGSRRSRMAAFHADRPAKDRTVSVEDLRTEWRHRAASLGIDTRELVAVVGRVSRAEPDRSQDVRLARGLDRLSAGRAQAAARDLVELVADAAPQGMDGARIASVSAALGDAFGSTPAASDRGADWARQAVLRALGTDGPSGGRGLGGGPRHPVEHGLDAGGPRHSTAEAFGRTGPEPFGRMR